MKQINYQTIRWLLSTMSPAAGHHMLRFGVAFLVSLLLPLGQVLDAWGADYHGQVVDAETGKLIEGAVLVVEWHKKPRISMSDINYFHNAREVLTDAEGRFSLDSSPGVDWNPFTYVDLAPYIVTFYPGYRPFTAANPEDIGIKGGLKEIADAFERGVVVKLRKLTSEKELRYFTSKGGFGPIMAPYAEIPNLLRLINVQRKIVGMRELTFP